MNKIILNARKDFISKKAQIIGKDGKDLQL